MGTDRATDGLGAQGRGDRTPARSRRDVLRALGGRGLLHALGTAAAAGLDRLNTVREALGGSAEEAGLALGRRSGAPRAGDVSGHSRERATSRPAVRRARCPADFTPGAASTSSANDPCKSTGE